MIAIKDMEMPKNCLDCPVRNYRDGEGNRCDLTGLYNRDDCCPLVEIITCKDCTKGQREYTDSKKYCMWIGRITEDNFYCADAERRWKYDKRRSNRNIKS